MGDLDIKIRDAFAAWRKLDETDVRILEGLSLLGPRNLALIGKKLDLPTTTVRYRVKRMLNNSILFLHMNPYHTNMGLKKAVVFAEASPGYEDLLLESLRVNDFWLNLWRIYGPYEGAGGVWTIPKRKAESFELYLKNLVETGVARSYEINWSTCFEGIPVQTRWFSAENEDWTFKWDEWTDEVKKIQGDLPKTLKEPDDWLVQVDKEDLLIIKELEINGRTTLTAISKKLNIPLETIKYHFREHVSKRGLIEGYQVEIYRSPFPLSEILIIKFEFDSLEKMEKFALSLHDKPFPIFMGKVLGENALISQIYLPKWEFRRFIVALSSLIRQGYLKGYHYVIQDMYQNWRETIPYQHFEKGKWYYDEEVINDKLNMVLEKWGKNIP